MKNWRSFERLVASLSSEEYDERFTVIPNARIMGHISGRKRQIDVLVDFRFDSDLAQRIIIDAKNKKRPIDIKEVESFEGLMKDVAAKRGILFCSNGYTKAAKKRAQEHIGIRLVSEEEIDSFELQALEQCADINCQKGLVLWDATPGIVIDGTVVVQMTGKCDECGKFHLWCWGCGNRHFMCHEDEWQCACKGPWFWLTSIEEDTETGSAPRKGNYLLLILGNGDVQVIDRRPL